MSVLENLKKISRQLYPTGRAFKLTKGELAERLDSTLLLSESRAVEDALSVLDEILPDNDNFTADDATRWEVRLGMINNTTLTLDDRKDAIIRKYNHPGDIPARQSHDYVEQSLQLAGFDVFVHENPNALTIQQVLAIGTPQFQNWGSQNFGQFNYGNVQSFYSQLFNQSNWGTTNFGQTNWGKGVFYNQKVANHIDPAKDVYFSVTNWLTAFYIGGPNLGDFANVPAARREELRQTILRLKPAHSIAFNLINYT